MIRYRVHLSPEIQSNAAHLVPLLKKKIKQTLKALEVNPLLGKPLLDELEGFWSIPISHHRIIYIFESVRKRIEIVMIAPRFEVYELLLEKIKKK